MGNTVNINQAYWDGKKGALHYVLTSDGTDLSDTSLLDISALSPAPNSVRITGLDIILNGNFEIVIEVDATTDQEVERLENQAVDQSFQYIRDYTNMPNGGKPANSKTAGGFTGDLIGTSTGLASGDGFNLLLTFEKDS